MPPAAQNNIQNTARRTKHGLIISKLRLESTNKNASGRRVWKLLEQFDVHLYVYRGVFEISVPEGYETDLASVPRIFWSIFPHDECAEAAVVHDFLYSNTRLDRHLADALFRFLLKASGIPYWKQLLMYLAVRMGGGGSVRPV